MHKSFETQAPDKKTCSCYACQVENKTHWAIGRNENSIMVGPIRLDAPNRYPLKLIIAYISVSIFIIYFNEVIFFLFLAGEVTL